MARNTHTFIGIDIATTKVACCVASISAEEELRIIGLGEASHSGSKKGVIHDPSEVISAITGAVDESERISGVTIGEAVISIGGNHVRSQRSTGVVAILDGDHGVSDKDIARVHEAARAVKVAPNEEIVTVYPLYYQVDEQTEIEDPHGMSGIRLEVVANVVTASTTAMRNIEKCMGQVGIRIREIIPTSIASARAILSDTQMQNGAVSIDIGANTTAVALFSNGILHGQYCLPLGSASISSDIAMGLRLNVEAAESAKQQFSAKLNDGQKSGHIHITDESGEQIKISMSDMAQIVNARTEEIFDLVYRTTKKTDAIFTTKPASITGGGSQIGYCGNIAKEVLGVGVTVTGPQNLRGIVEKATRPSSSVAVGLMLSDFDNYQSYSDRGGTNSMTGIFDKFKAFFRGLLP